MQEREDELYKIMQKCANFGAKKCAWAKENPLPKGSGEVSGPVLLHQGQHLSVLDIDPKQGLVVRIGRVV